MDRHAHARRLYPHQWVARGGEKQQGPSIFEILGAWLRIWVPPRDVEIPPVPWRKLGIGFGVGALVLGGVLAVAIPRIDEDKDRRSAEVRAERARAASANRERIIHVQRPLHGEAPSVRPAADASAPRAPGRPRAPAAPSRGRHPR